MPQFLNHLVIKLYPYMSNYVTDQQKQDAWGAIRKVSFQSIKCNPHDVVSCERAVRQYTEL